MEFTYTVAKKIKAPVLNPPKSGMFFPPSYVFLRRNHQLLAAITSEPPLPLTVTTTINNDGGFLGSCKDDDHINSTTSMAPSPTFHGSPHLLSSLTGLVPCQPHMCPMSTSSLPSGHRSQETSLNTTHIRTCARPSSSTHSSSRLSLTPASRLLADKEKPLIISLSLWRVQRTVFIILSGENGEHRCCLWLWFEFWFESDNWTSFLAFLQPPLHLALTCSLCIILGLYMNTFHPQLWMMAWGYLWTCQNGTSLNLSSPFITTNSISIVFGLGHHTTLPPFNSKRLGNR